MKFQRVFELTVQGQTFTHQLSTPLTLSLDVKRDTLASANTGRFVLYNLKETTRRDIFHDRYDTLNYKQIQLKAGYSTDKTLPIIFQGNVQVAGSRREGPNWITELECFDGGFGMINGQAAVTKPAGWNARDLFKSLVGGMPNVSLNAVGQIENQSTRGITVVGNAWDGVQSVIGEDFAFIDNERVNILAEDEYILVNGVIPLITGATGLLNSPRRQNAMIEVDLLFEPRLVVGQIVQLESLETVNNGFYQVRGVAHRGLISDAVDGGVVTTASLWVGTSRLNQVASAPAVGV